MLCVGVSQVGFTSRSESASLKFHQPGLSAHHTVRISHWECKNRGSQNPHCVCTIGFPPRSGTAKHGKPVERAPLGSHLILRMQNVSFGSPACECTIRVRISFWECKCKPRFRQPSMCVNHTGSHLRSGNAKPKFRQPRMRVCTIGFASPARNQSVCAPVCATGFASHSGYAKHTFAVPA